MKVYVASWYERHWDGEGGDWWNDGVFSTREAAEKHLKRLYPKLHEEEYTDIEEWELDEDNG